MPRFITFMVCVLILFCAVSLTKAQSTSCTLAPRLVVGGRGWMLPGLPNRLRNEPSTQGLYLGNMAEGSLFDVLEGPQCSEGIVWWRIQYHDLQGWTAEGQGDEYWLQPVSVITGANSSSLTEFSRFGYGSFTSNLLWLDDGRIAVAGGLGIWLFDGDDYTAAPHLLSVDTKLIPHIALLSDGSLVSVGCENTQPYPYTACTARFWDLSSGTELRTVSLAGGFGWTITTNDDGSIVASATSEGVITLWNTADGSVLNTLTGHSTYINALEFHGDVLISGGYDGELFMWDVDSGTIRARLSGHTAKINDIQWSPDGSMFAVSSDDETISLWDAEGTQRFIVPNMGEEVRTFCDENNNCYTQDGLTAAHGLTFNQNGTTLAGINYTSITIWDVATGTQTRAIDGASGDLRDSALAYSPDGSRFAVINLQNNIGARQIEIWSAFASQHVTDLESGHNSAVGSLAFHPSGTTLASADHRGGDVHFWDITTGRETIPDLPYGASTVAFSPDGMFLAAGGMYSPEGCECTIPTIWLWDMSNEQLANTLQGYGAQEFTTVGLGFNLDGSELGATLYFDRGISFWSTSTALQVHEVPARGTEQQFIQNELQEANVTAFAPDLSLIATSDWEGNTHLWSRATSSELYTLVGRNNIVWDLVFSHDATRLAAANGLFGATAMSGQQVDEDNTVRIWDTATGNELIALQHDTSVTSVMFSPDDTLIASGTIDGTLYLWDSPTYTLLTRVATGCETISDIAFIPDSTLLATACGDWTVRLLGIYQP